MYSFPNLIKTCIPDTVHGAVSHHFGHFLNLFTGYRCPVPEEASHEHGGHDERNASKKKNPADPRRDFDKLHSRLYILH